MQTKPNKPEIFAGWQDVFPPINLNFTKHILPFIKNSTTFIEFCNKVWQLVSTISPLLAPTSIGVAVAAVCREAYPISYDRLGLFLAVKHPNPVVRNLHLKN